MRTQKLLVFLGLSIAVIALSSRSLGLAEMLNQDRTGAPGSFAGACASCHNGGTYVVAMEITLLDVITGEEVLEYIPGTQYDVKFEVDGSGSPGSYGFQGTAVLDSDASNAGIFTNPSNNAQLEDVNGRHIVEHNDQSISGSFTFKWAAPSSGSGSVSFYAAGMANNFNGSTSGDNGSLSVQLTIPEGSLGEIEGCTDATACNFNPDATIDDGSCQLPDGCTDMFACNYDPAALCDDGTCLLLEGCTDQTACNYDPSAACDDGSCQLPDGCTDQTACNYDPTALCDDGSCLDAPCVGCTYAAAQNYDPFALEDDGSCTFFNPQDYCGEGTVFNPDTGQCESINAGCLADLDGNNSVGTGDVLILLSAFGTTCPE